jgi:hypothetical protein
MDLAELLEHRQAAIIFDAHEALNKSRLPHYSQSHAVENTQRLTNLFRLVIQSIKTKNLIPIVTFSQDLARQRFQQGFDLSEVQTAYHVLEETLWRHLTKLLPADEYPTAFGLVGTVLGAGTDALALEYVSLASKRRTPTLDLRAMFTGT